MPMSKTVAELRATPVEQLIREHDETAKSTLVGTDYYLNELARRDALRLAEEAAASTRRVEILTWFIAILTMVNVVAVFIGLFVA